MIPDKLKIMFAGIGILIGVFVIGFVLFNSVASSLDGHQSAQINATMTSLDTTFSMGPMFLAVLSILALISLTAYFVSNSKRYAFLGKVFNFLSSSLYYFVIGLIPIGSLVIIYFISNLLWTYTVVDGNTQYLFESLKWIILLVVGFFGISGVGYIFKRGIINKYLERRKEKCQNTIQ